ncbi:MAG: LysM peptidoglycan-binding domain-containing protein [Anaerolineales bacterium]
MRRPTILPPPASPRLCPLCGSRVSEQATKCLVCGTNLARAAAKIARPRRRFYPSPFVLGVFAVLLVIGMLLMGLATGQVPMPAVFRFPTPTVTPTFTPRPTPTATATVTETPVPTSTPEPPISYVIKDGDSCLGIAIQYDITVESLILENRLDPDCTVAVGHTIRVPRPTPTIGSPPTEVPPGTTPLPTVPPYPTYIVVEGDSCLAIALQNGLTVDELMRANGIADCNFLLLGQSLRIPPPATATAAP